MRHTRLGRRRIPTKRARPKTSIAAYASKQVPPDRANGQYPSHGAEETALLAAYAQRIDPLQGQIESATIACGWLDVRYSAQSFRFQLHGVEERRASALPYLHLSSGGKRARRQIVQTVPAATTGRRARHDGEEDCERAMQAHLPERGRLSVVSARPSDVTRGGAEPRGGRRRWRPPRSALMAGRTPRRAVRPGRWDRAATRRDRSRRRLAPPHEP